MTIIRCKAGSNMHTKLADNWILCSFHTKRGLRLVLLTNLL